MTWKKLGLIFDLSKHKLEWLKSHAMIPTPLLIDRHIRIFFTGRDNSNHSRISFVDVDKSDPSKVLYVHDKPLFDIGGIGTFDDCGTLATCAVRNQEQLLLYYTAYSISFKVPYKNAIGVAISKDSGARFERMFEGPIVDRSRAEPYFVISPWVIKTGENWHMWYASATEWKMINGKPESLYHIKYAHSKNGLDWQRDNISCIIPLTPYEANARPTVIADSDTLKMWFCYRGSHDFRDGTDSYRIGYAEANSEKPFEWIRKDALAGIAPGPDNYDDKMQAYPAVIEVDGKRYLFYNGNGFGSGGFCCAVWE